MICSRDRMSLWAIASLILYSTDNLNNSHITTDFLYYFLETRVENFTLFEYLIMTIKSRAKLILFIFDYRIFCIFFMQSRNSIFE